MRKVMLIVAAMAMVLVMSVPALAQTPNQTNVYGPNRAAGNDIISQVCGNYVTNSGNVYGTIDASGNVTCFAGGMTYVVQMPAGTMPAAKATAPAAKATASAKVEAKKAESKKQLPKTGGAALLTLGAGVVLVGGGLLARRIAR